jgi:hypothetical protein
VAIFLEKSGKYNTIIKYELLIIPQYYLSTTKPQNMDGSVARMSNADRLSYGHGLPMSDRLVDIGPVKQQAPSTSSQPSLAHPSQWIRRDTRRYTQQGAAFQNLNFVPPTALAPPKKRILPSLKTVKRSEVLLKYYCTTHREWVGSLNELHRPSSLRARPPDGR